MGKAKVMCASKAKQGTHSPLPIGGLVFSHPQESRTPSYLTVTWEDKCMNSECPPFFLLPTAFIAERAVLFYGIFLWVAGVSCPSHVLSQLLMHTQPTCWQGGVSSRKSLDIL